MNGSCRFEKDILLLDTLGDLEKFYEMGDVAFVGGSLVDEGGHNLLEPARFRKPVLFGPYTANFAALAAEMKNSGAGIEVRGAEDLEEALVRLLSDQQKRREAGEQSLSDRPGRSRRDAEDSYSHKLLSSGPGTLMRSTSLVNSNSCR